MSVPGIIVWPLRRIFAGRPLSEPIRTVDSLVFLNRHPFGDKIDYEGRALQVMRAVVRKAKHLRSNQRYDGAVDLQFTITHRSTPTPVVGADRFKRRVAADNPLYISTTNAAGRLGVDMIDLRVGTAEDGVTVYQVTAKMTF